MAETLIAVHTHTHTILLKNKKEMGCYYDTPIY